MATITYVDDRYNERQWTFDPPINVFRTIGEYLDANGRGDVLVLHGGQKNGRVLGESGQYLLVELMLDACRDDRRAILFSGGHPLVGLQAIREVLAAASLVEGLHYLLLPAIHKLKEEIDFDALILAKPEPGWRIDAFKKKHAVPTLLALGVLCQAALLAVEPDQVYDYAAKLLGGREEMRALRQQCGSPAAQRMLAPQTWRNALEDLHRDEVMSAITREWPRNGGQRRELTRLVEAVWTDGRPLDARMLSAAFTELHAALTAETQS